MAVTLERAKIALACSGLSHVQRGVETWTAQAFGALRVRGFDVTLFQGSGANGLPGLPAPARSASQSEAAGAQAGVHVLSCVRREGALSRALAPRLPSWGWRVGFGSAYQMEQTTFALPLLAAVGRRYDLVHTKDPQVAALVQAAHGAGLIRAKVILNHGTEEPPEFLSRFEFVQHLAPVHLAEAQRAGVRARQFVVPNFVDTSTFAPADGTPARARLGIPADAFVVLCVAALKRHHKRLDHLIREAAAVTSGARLKRLPSRQPRNAEGESPRPLWLVLAGAPTEETEAIAGQLREALPGRAVMLVNHPREAMPGLYRAADVFALCSLREMLANACLEALASGVPVIMHQDPVAQWAIGQGGIVVDMTQPGGLAGALGGLMADEARRRALGAAARAQALRQFATEIVLDQHVQMYREVLGCR